MLVSSGTDGTVRLWNIDSLEQRSEFYVPRKEGLCIDVYPEGSKCVCGFSDGFVRFFDYERNVNYGGSLLRADQRDQGYAVTAVAFLKNGKNILAGNMNGEVYMIYVKNWENIRIEYKSLISNVGFGIHHIDLNPIKPWDTWLLSTKNKKVMVWDRKDLSFGDKSIDYYNKIFAKVDDLEYYLIDNYKVLRKDEKEHFESETNLSSTNKYECPGNTLAKFMEHKPDMYVVITNNLQEVYFRDYREHMVFLPR